MAGSETILACPDPPRFGLKSDIIFCQQSQELPSQPSRRPPDFGFPVYTTPRNSALSLMDIPTIASDSLNTPLRNSSEQCTFTIIPAEIRLQIYHYVLLSHPVRHAHLALEPGSLSAPHRLHHPETIVLSKPPNLNPLGRSNPSQPTLSLSSLRRHSEAISPSKIPFGLLASCRQIYEETKLLPFHYSNFSFVNWHNSGIYAACHFSRSLREWQSEALQNVSLETGEYHLRGRNLEEWKELISLWVGVRTLRLYIQSSTSRRAKSVAIIESRLGLESRRDAHRRGEEAGLGVVGVVGEAIDTLEFLCAESRWVREGVLNLNSLRRLELEIENEDIHRDAKLVFCTKLQGLLNSKTRRRKDDWDGEIKVVLVEKPKEVAKKKEVSVGISFHNANDAIWGLEVVREIGVWGLSAWLRWIFPYRSEA